MDITVVPSRMAFLRPSISPMEKAATAPKKQPTSYRAVTVPRSDVSSGPLRFRVFKKSGVTMTPPSSGQIDANT